MHQINYVQLNVTRSEYNQLWHPAQTCTCGVVLQVQAFQSQRGNCMAWSWLNLALVHTSNVRVAQFNYVWHCVPVTVEDRVIISTATVCSPSILPGFLLSSRPSQPLRIRLLETILHLHGLLPHHSTRIWHKHGASACHSHLVLVLISTSKSARAPTRSLIIRFKTPLSCKRNALPPSVTVIALLASSWKSPNLLLQWF